MSNYALTKDDLLEFGFKQHAPNPVLDRNDESFQFTVRDDQRNRVLFVNVRFWQHSKYGDGATDSFDAVAYFDCGDRHVRLYDIGVSHRKPAEIVEWFTTAFHALGGTPYDFES